MRMQALLAILTVSTLAFAGCAGSDDPEPSETTGPSSSPGPGGSSSETTTEPPANQPPSGNLAAEVNGTAVRFTITGSDPDNDTLAWELDLGDGATANGTEFPATVNHTYMVGDYTANLTVSDGTDVVGYNVTLQIIEAGSSGGSNTLTVTDPALDAPPMWDITQVEASLTDTNLVVVFDVGLVGPGAGDWPALFRVYVDDLILEAYVLVGGGVWNVGDNEATGGTSAWDPVAGTLTVAIPLSYLEGKASRPYEVFFDSQAGEGQAGGVQQVDRVPDSGTLVLG